jgi:hypothetical protein
VNKTDSQSFETKLNKDPKIKEKKIREPKVKQENKLAQFGETITKSTSQIAKVFGPLHTEAQTTTPNWVPNASTTYFYDADDLGMYPINNWDAVLAVGGTLSPSQVSLASGNGRTFLAYRGFDNNIYLRNTSSNLDDAKPLQNVSGGKTTDTSPSVEWYYGKLYVIIKDASNNIFWRSSTDSTVTTWTGWNQISGQMKNVEMKRHVNRLYIAGRDLNNRVQMMFQDNGSNLWSAWALQGNTTTSHKPVLASYFNKLYVGFRGLDGKGYANNNATVWSDVNNKVVRGLTSDSFGMAGYNNRLCFVFRDNDTQNSQYCTTDSNLTSERYAIFSYFKSNTAPTLNGDYHLVQASVAAPGNLNLTGVTMTTNQIYTRKLTTYSNVRGYISDMRWDTANAFNSNQGYEQDIFLSNVAGNNYSTYLTKADSGFSTCYPTTSWFTSSLPNPYLDTRFYELGKFVCDSADSGANGEISYTIGTGSPNLIQPNVVYINNYEAAKGSRDKPVFKVIAGLGSKNVPPNCLFGLVEDRWCIFSTENRIMVDFDPNITNTSTFPYFVKSRKTVV